jgi:hypothetical protein
MKTTLKRMSFVAMLTGVLSSAAWGEQLTTEWAASAGYPGTPSKVVTDAAGNVYVTGSTYSADTNMATSKADMLTVKYDSKGVKQWEVTYNSPFNTGSDAGYNLVVDTAGNVYVAGTSFTSPAYYTGGCAVVVKYSSTGQQLWATRYADSNYGTGGSGIDVDSAGNVYLTLTTIYDFAYNSTATDGVIVKYDTNGNRVWKYLMAIGHYGDDWASKVMVKNGYVYASGTFNGGDHGYGDNMRNSMVWKFTLNGQLVWKAVHDGGNADYFADFTVDGQDNVYIATMSDRLRTGYTMWDKYLYDYATAKFNANGQLLWSSRYNNTGSGNHAPSSIAVDAAGDVYVSGTSDGDGTTGKDIATVKYRGTDGAQLWVDRYNGTSNGDEQGGPVLVDPNGDAYVAGTSLNGSRDFTTIKYGQDGTRQMVELYNGTASGNDTLSSLALDANNNVIVAGGSNDANGIPQFLTVKYTQDKTPPVVDAGPDVTIEATGPAGAPFTLNPTVTDNGTIASVVITPELATYPLGTTAITVTATDAAGNVGTGSMSLTVVDTTPPTLTVPPTIHVPLNTTSSAAAVQAFLAAASATDTVDTKVTISYQVPALNSVGPKTVLFTATDDAGNMTTASSTIQVDYVFGGFLPPVSLGKQFKLGSTVPVKFQLTDSNGALVTTAVAKLQLQKLSGNEGPIDADATNHHHGDLFRFDDGQYIFNLNSKHLQSGTYQIRVLLDDGTTRVTNVSFKE